MSETCRDMTKRNICKINPVWNSSWWLGYNQHLVTIKKIICIIENDQLIFHMQ